MEVKYPAGEAGGDAERVYIYKRPNSVTAIMFGRTSGACSRTGRTTYPAISLS